MDEKIRCLGFSESTLKRCKRSVGKSRLKAGFVTCDRHTKQEDIAKQHVGDVDDDLRIVEHFLREKGLIPAEVVKEQPVERDQKRISTREFGGELSALSAAELRRLQPQQFKARTNWKNFGGGLQVKDFKEGQALTEGVGSHRAAVLGALANNAKEFGFLFAPAVALASALGLFVYYFSLGFGFQSVVVDPTSVTATAFLAVILTISAFWYSNSKIKNKDKKRREQHQTRHEKVNRFIDQLEKMSKGSERISKSIDLCMQGKKRRESARITARYLALLNRKKDAEDRFWNRLVRWVSKRFSRGSNAPLAVDKPHLLSLSKVTARELVTSEAVPIEDRIRELQNRNADYVEAEIDLKSQQEAAWNEDKIERLNGWIAKDNAELKRFETNSLWVLLAFSTRPYVVTGFGLVTAMFLVAVGSLWAVNNAERYCTWAIRPINCFYLEVTQSGANSEVTTFHEHAFVHGRVSDHFLVSSLGTDKDPATTVGVARLNIAVSSVVGMQRHGRNYTRIGPSDPIVPVIILTQENAFLVNHNTALASGDGGGTETKVVNYQAEFPVDNRNITQLTLNNEFQTDVLVRKDISPILVSNFILDGKKLQEPGDGELRHILVPFFLDLVQSGGTKRRAIYAVEKGPSIDTELDAFMAGFFSLSDPEFDLEDPTSEKLASPTNLLSMVRTALRACSPRDETGATLMIDISGYSSEMPFRGINGEVIPTSAPLNHAVAEGRRLAVLANVVDYDLSLVEEDKAKVILSPREWNPEQEGFSVPVQTFIKLLKSDTPADLVAFLESVDRIALLVRLKSEVFRFTSKDDMNAHLKLWVPSGDHADEPVREAFQRSAVISISKDELRKCRL